MNIFFARHSEWMAKAGEDEQPSPKAIIVAQLKSSRSDLRSARDSKSHR
jgi:hypothetical protein